MMRECSAEDRIVRPERVQQPHDAEVDRPSVGRRPVRAAGEDDAAVGLHGQCRGLAEIAVDLWHGIDLVPTIGYTVANLAQPLLGAALLRAFVKWPDLGKADDLGKFLACAVIAGSALGSGRGIGGGR